MQTLAFLLQRACKHAVHRQGQRAGSAVQDGIVTMVDAKHVHKRLNDEVPAGFINEALEQIAYADRIILNKTDLVRLRPGPARPCCSLSP